MKIVLLSSTLFSQLNFDGRDDTTYFPPPPTTHPPFFLSLPTQPKTFEKKKRERKLFFLFQFF
jgi:hypothetical protein